MIQPAASVSRDPCGEVECAHLSMTGPQRPNNQDVIGLAEPAGAAEAAARGWLCVLADGVGGAARGEVAAATAVATLLRGYHHGDMRWSRRLPALLRHANQEVYNLRHGQGARPGGGAPLATTVVACAIRGGTAVVAHAGDSRCSLVRGGRLLRLTRDHVRRRTWWRPGSGPVLARAVGAELFLPVAVRRLRLCPGDVLVLTSDGLHASISGPEIAAVLDSAPSLAAAASALVALAEQRDGSDNMSVALLRWRAAAPAGAAPPL